MDIPEMSDYELYKNYTALLIEIDNNYNVKKQLEEEMKKRFRGGKKDE